jgi:hypothetical protein
MRTARWVFAFTAAALLACVPESESPPAAAAGGEIDREDPETAAALQALEKSSEADREEKLEAYLGAVRRDYRAQSRAYLGEEARDQIDIAVPPVEPIDRKAPDLMPQAAEAERP